MTLAPHPALPPLPVPAMPRRQRELARNALGLPNESDRSYRNRYLTSGATAAEWQAMVAAGLAEDGGPEGSRRWFHLTRTGAEAALENGERLCPEDFPEPGAAPAP